MNIRNLATSNKFFGFQEGRPKTEDRKNVNANVKRILLKFKQSTGKVADIYNSQYNNGSSCDFVVCYKRK